MQFNLMVQVPQKTQETNERRTIANEPTHFARILFECVPHHITSSHYRFQHISLSLCSFFPKILFIGLCFVVVFLQFSVSIVIVMVKRAKKAVFLYMLEHRTRSFVTF